MMKSPNGAKSPPPRPPPPDFNVMKSRQQRQGGKSKISSKSSAINSSKLGDGPINQHQNQHHNSHQHHHHHHHQQQQQDHKSPSGQSDQGKLVPTRPAPPSPPILTPGGSQQYQSPVPAAEFGPSSMAKVLGSTAAAAASTPSHPHSTSSSSYRGEPLTRSVPTLGTITASPQETTPHVSPFPASDQQQQPSYPPQMQQQAPSTATTATLTSSAPATSAASSTTAALTPTKGATPTSSINTGTTPLTTTPGGTSQPIKLTMSGLAAAVAASSATKSALTSGGASRPESPQTKSPGDGRSQTVIVVTERTKQAVESPDDPQAGAMIKAPILGLNQQQQREQLTNKAPSSAGPITAPTKSNFCNCAIYIFLGIFLLIIVALIIVLVLNRKK